MARRRLDRELGVGDQPVFRKRVKNPFTGVDPTDGGLPQVPTADGLPPGVVTALGSPGASPQKQKSDEIKAIAASSNDINQLIQIFRGAHNSETGPLAHETNAVAGDRLSELTGIERNLISGAHDDEIRQAAQGRAEQRQLEAQAEEQQGQINQFADEFSGRAGEFRKKLSESLLRNNQEAFELGNPFILEDLNRRGLFTSPSAVATAQTQAQKELELDRQNKLTAFDADVFGQEEDLRSGGLSAFVGGRQSALNEALNARRSGLQRAFSAIDRDNEMALANSLAKKQRRSSLTNALIGAGSNIIAGRLSRPSSAATG